MSRGYDRLAWVDYPAELTPISAENLNRIEDGIENLYTDRDHMEGNLAVVDDNERAARDYDINTYIMHNGIFYKVILDIQENEEFNDEAGGNIRPVSVSSQLGSGGGGSTGCVELTQAEYDALPEEDKMADVIYLITDTPNNFLDEVFGDFASVEYTNKASKAYAVGEYLMLDSKLYRVTAAISQNDTIAAGTNVIATTVGSEFNAVGNRLHNVLGNYAEVEPEAVASKIYAAGDFLILNDYLYKTTSAIATGEDLIEETNIEKTTVGAEMEEFKAKPRWVELTGIRSSQMTAGTYKNISTRGRTFDEFCLIRLNTSYYEEGLPDYGGITISYEELRRATSEGIVVARFDAEYSFTVKYINNTTLSVVFTGTTSTNKCLSVHGIL